jgi:hypothetical protein
MLIRPRHALLAVACLALSSIGVLAQALPTSQPRILQIFQERIKVGHAADHVRTESGWPAAYERAKSPDHYLALSSMTGPQEVWFMNPWESYAAWGKSMQRDDSNDALAADIERISAADAVHVESMTILEAMARPDLSHGAFPDLNKQRFWEITVMRIRPGQDEAFAAAANAYKAIATRNMPNARWRVYQIMSGMTGPAYLIISSVESFDKFDVSMAEGMEAMKAMTSEERALFKKFDAEALINTVSNKYRLDPDMSYVAAETKAADPAFWSKK